MSNNQLNRARKLNLGLKSHSSLEILQAGYHLEIQEVCHLKKINAHINELYIISNRFWSDKHDYDLVFMIQGHFVLLIIKKIIIMKK